MNRVVLARIDGTHGVRGEVRVTSFTEEPLAFAEYGTLANGDGRVFDVVSVRPARSAIIVKFAGIDSREAARALNGTELLVERDALPEIFDPDEFYQADLVGLRVETETGEPAGEVLAVHDFGAGEILEIGSGRGKTQMYVFTRDNFPLVDVDGGRIVLAPPGTVEARRRGRS